MQINQLLEEATARLKKAGISEPEANVQFLLAHVLGVARTWVLVNGSFNVPASDEKLFFSLLSRKERGVPLAHITGVQPFCGLDILVTPDTLIPRPETENLVEIIAEKFDKKGRYTFIDMCSGSGCIAVALAVKFPHAQILAVDVSAKALEVAAQNVRKHKLSERVQLLQSNLWENVMGTFDLIISNPPYIPTKNLSALSLEVKQEPRLALDGGADGYEVTRPLCQAADSYLNPGGWLALELDDGQPWPLARGLEEIGWRAEVKKDIFNVERFVLAQKN